MKTEEMNINALGVCIKKETTDTTYHAQSPERCRINVKIEDVDIAEQFIDANGIHDSETFTVKNEYDSPQQQEISYPNSCEYGSNLEEEFDNNMVSDLNNRSHLCDNATDQLDHLKPFNIKFVEEVEKHPVLYDFNLQDYSRKDITEAAWILVGKEVNLSAAESKERWRNLRSTLGRNLRPKASGSGTSKKKPYYLTQAMQFAIPFMKISGTSTGNLTQENKPSPSSISTADDSEIEETVPGSEPSDIVGNEQPSPTDQLGTVTIPALQNPASITQVARDLPVDGAIGPNPFRKRKLLSNTQSDVDKAFSDYFSAKATKLSNPSHNDIKEAGIKHFVTSLIPDLMSMSDSQLRRFKMETLRLIDDILTTPSPSHISPTSFTRENPQIEFECTD